MPKGEPMKAKTAGLSASSPLAEPLRESGEPIVTSAEDAFAQAKVMDWPENFPTGDAEIDLSDIPEQDWSGPDVVRGRYRELALAAAGFVMLDPDVRAAFPDTTSVNRALRGVMSERQK
jgi:hypothetical protein